MNHPNGRDIFPPALLKQIQKYVSGQSVYIPAASVRKAWGETSGYKRYIFERNQKIRQRFRNGESAGELAEAFSLSVDSIRRIIYSKKELILLNYSCSLSSAKAYSAQNRLEEWVHLYLLSDGHNKDFSDGLKLFDRFFLGPLRMPLSLLHRCCGPEDSMTYRVDAEWFEKHVSELMDVIQATEDIAPLIVHYVNGDFELNDGNHRFEAYQRLGITETDVIVWITEAEELDRFQKEYGHYLNQ